MNLDSRADTRKVIRYACKLIVDNETLIDASLKLTLLHQYLRRNVASKINDLDSLFEITHGTSLHKTKKTTTIAKLA